MSFVIASSLAFAFSGSSAFSVQVMLDGYLPIFGGREGSATVKMTILTKGVVATEAGALAVESKVDAIEAKANGAKLPLTKSNAELFFPTAIAEFTPLGKVIKNTAPKVAMPARIPGLDSRRLPEISYLPLELPPAGVIEGGTYSFKREFQGSPVTYEVKWASTAGDVAEFTFTLRQSDTSYEDGYRNPVEKAEEATSRLETVLEGEGRATFDLRGQNFKRVEVDATSKSLVTEIATSKSSRRTLRTRLLIEAGKRS